MGTLDVLSNDWCVGYLTAKIGGKVNIRTYPDASGSAAGGLWFAIDHPEIFKPIKRVMPLVISERVTRAYLDDFADAVLEVING